MGQLFSQKPIIDGVGTLQRILPVHSCFVNRCRTLFSSCISINLFAYSKGSRQLSEAPVAWQDVFLSSKNVCELFEKLVSSRQVLLCLKYTSPRLKTLDEFLLFCPDSCLASCTRELTTNKPCDKCKETMFHVMRTEIRKRYDNMTRRADLSGILYNQM